MGILDPRSKTTQAHLDIEDIKDDMVVLKNGTVSIVMQTSSINFDLLAEREQDVRILTFAGLLNSLTFPIQIVIRTQRVDISKYQNALDEYKNKVGYEPIQQQVAIYQQFISTLTSTTQILDKEFYAIIPTVNSYGEPSGALQQLMGAPSHYLNVDKALEKAKIELSPKRDHLIKQFANMGLQATQLTSDKLIKLFYSVYEPDQKGLGVINVADNAVTIGVDQLPEDATQVVADNPFNKNNASNAQVPLTTPPK